ncbi:MAG: glycosyltransferase, partial [Pseudomonadota bacterium]
MAVFVTTRFGIGLTDSVNLAHRLKLFEVTVLPSLINQTYQDFHWLILIDARLDGDILQSLKRLIVPFPHFHLVRVDVLNSACQSIGSYAWIWASAMHYIIACKLCDDPRDYVLTANIDDDDAWHRDALKITAKVTRTQIDPHLLSHNLYSHGKNHSVGASQGFILSYPNGYEWYIHENIAQKISYPSHSMGNFIYSRLSSCMSPLSYDHAFFLDVSANRFQFEQQDHIGPMWVYTRHALNITRIIRDDISDGSWQRPNILDHKTNATLQNTFGIDMQKALEYQKLHR